MQLKVLNGGAEELENRQRMYMMSVLFGSSDAGGAESQDRKGVCGLRTICLLARKFPGVEEDENTE